MKPPSDPRFKAEAAFARHAAVAPTGVSTAGQILSRSGNRQSTPPYTASH